MALQVFVPREDLSLDVIKQYQVVSSPLESPLAWAAVDGSTHIFWVLASHRRL